MTKSAYVTRSTHVEMHSANKKPPPRVWDDVIDQMCPSQSHVLEDSDARPHCRRNTGLGFFGRLPMLENSSLFRIEIEGGSLKSRAGICLTALALPHNEGYTNKAYCDAVRDARQLGQKENRMPNDNNAGSPASTQNPPASPQNAEDPKSIGGEALKLQAESAAAKLKDILAEPETEEGREAQ